MKPFIEWVGGKTQLLDRLVANMPQSYDRYFEPFVGGGALFLHTQPQTAFINDANQQLINVYRQIKCYTNELIESVNALDEHPLDSEYFYFLRNQYNIMLQKNEYSVGSAALMMWLVRHCFNGVYRVNQKGLFNSPINPKRVLKTIADEQNLRDVGTYLSSANVTISCGDFESFLDNVRKDDFVYFDPPYVPLNDTANFTQYTKNGFNLQDHERLADVFRKLDKKGAKLMQSNSDTDTVRALYKGYEIITVDAIRSLNCKGDKRKCTEIIIKN